MLGIFGGTFDPIHYGHLSAAWQAYENLGLTQLRFMPCHLPPHRIHPHANAAQRIQMLKLAIENIPEFAIDARELETDALSYTVNSLTAIRNEAGDTPICLLLGSDAFSHIATWHQPEKLLQLAHLVIVDRPDAILKRNDFIDNLLTHEIKDPQQLQHVSHGALYFEKNTRLAISSTIIRQMLASHISPRFLLPEAVLDYIEENQLYTHAI